MSRFEEDERPVSDQRDEVPIEFPAQMEEMLANFFENREAVVGWGFLCNNPIPAEEHFMSGTYAHNCERGRAIVPATAELEIEAILDPEVDEPAEILRDLALSRRRCRVWLRSY